jgi:hypothetical protein
MKEDTLAAGASFATFTGEQVGASDKAKDLSRQITSLGGVLGTTQDKLYGTASAAREAGDSVGYAALKMGDASIEFLKAQITADDAFQNLFKGDKGSRLADALAKGGFDLDKFTKIMSSKGEEAGEAYVEGVLGQNIYGLFETGEEVGGLSFNQKEMALSAQELVKIGASGVAGFAAIANAALIAGDGVIKFTSATQLAGDDMENFKVQNEDAINSIAEAYGKFVDTGSLINFTQGFREAALVQDDLATEVNESAVAAAGAEKAWADYYGGTAFSIGEYMTVFRRAAEEQAQFSTNLSTLSARGVSSSIIQDLAEVGPAAAQLVGALVSSTDAELQEYIALYGSTGFDSMVALAAGQLAAETIVRSAARTLSAAQLQVLSADLSAGTPLVEAMAKWNLDAQGKPMKAPATAELNYYNDQRKLQEQAYRLGFNIPVTPYLTKSVIEVAQPGHTVQRGTVRMYDQGGWTGPGSKYKEAGTVHADEFVFTKKATNAIGVSNLYRMMQQAQNGRSAPRGYASGGLVGAGSISTGAGYTELSPTDRGLLRAIIDAVDFNVSIGSDAVAVAADSGNGRAQARGAA